MKTKFVLRETVKTFDEHGKVNGTAQVERPLSRKAIRHLAPGLYAEARLNQPRQSRRARGQGYWMRQIATKYERIGRQQREKQVRAELAGKLAKAQQPSMLDTLKGAVRRFFSRRAA